MDPKKFDTCKDKVRQSVVVEIDKLLATEWDRLISSIGAVCDMDEGFPLTITVNLTPHEGGIVHASSLKYKCSREASGEPGFVRYDGTDTVQGDLFDNADDFEDMVAELACSTGNWKDFDEFMNKAREVILEHKLATAGVLMIGLTIGDELANKTLQLLELQGFLGPRVGDDPRDIVSLRPSAEPVDDVKPKQEGQVTDPITSSLIAKGYPDKETFLSQAQEQVVETGRATITIIQRRLQVPFEIAQWALEQLQERGVVTKPDSEGKREVITAAESNAAAEDISNG